ncbi:hypothetical protein TSH7_10020 [Azospirillum sp. TSH7]|uniref:hypothetical protein n=1 Tax=unclassified Azospirillum TaxID=2630922 RepID=UPI000D60FA31|nr:MULTISPECIES: hypothetical protein [unclassified Azospirillum]PWC64004.1 hypothetical protein TSH20_19115 [Azospirillum sp. TSH20]PWC64867.1 hypothetical protein TSH7_10020 [Azospirillum sp. TSH7]
MDATVMDGVIASLRDECVFALRTKDKGRLAEASRRLKAATMCLRSGVSAEAALEACTPKGKDSKGKGKGGRK